MDKEASVTKIIAVYEDGTTKEITKGMCIDMSTADALKMNAELLDMSPKDIERLTYGMIYVCEHMGLFEHEEGAAHEED